MKRKRAGGRRGEEEKRGREGAETMNKVYLISMEVLYIL